MQSAFAKRPVATKETATPLAIKSKSYTDAYRFVMAKFNKRFYGTLYCFSLFFAILFQLKFTLNYHTYFNVLSWKTFFFSSFLFSVGSFISLLRNLSYTVWEPAYPSYIVEVIAVWTSLDNLFLLGAYSVTSLFLIRPYFSWIMGEKYTSGFLLQPPGHYLGARQLNQENIFICVYAIILAFNYTFDYLSKRGYVVKINHVQQPFFFEVKTSLATVLYSSAMRAIYSFRNAYIIFVFCNGSIYYYVAHFFGFYNRVLDSPIIGFRWIDLHLFFRLIVAGMLTTVIYNITNRLYEATYSYTLPLTDPYINQFDCLVEGLAEKKRDYIKVAAFSELAILSTKRPDKRQQLFNTIGRELTDSAWYKIMVQCFDVINEFRSKIDIEYNGIQKELAATPAPVVEPVEQKIRNRLEFSDAPVFTSIKKHIIDYDDRTCSVFKEVVELAEDSVPDDLTSRVQNYARQSFAQLPQSPMIKMIKGIEIKFNCVGAFEPYYAETITRRVQIVFNKYRILIWAVQSLGSLTASSLKEDVYGYVQNDIGNVLNHLLGCLQDVEKYVELPPVHYSKLLNENVIVGETQAVIMALREAIYQITNAFSEYADGFQVDNKYKQKWERFLTYQE